LLEKGANPNIQNNNGRTAIEIATGNESIIGLFTKVTIKGGKRTRKKYKRMTRRRKMYRSINKKNHKSISNRR